ncbi:hypothetical protein OIB37_35320 [Streptomyces sp. NBC_00820]|uniref:hypothetical protein n=1 Tax=Streptomyces sp. NBC_00820 TaxID=2975842 RepID=UPI002ED52F2A|nr:hypothetical protein OIB37_35320 [Streptomyces sp. NBC_00820]
MSPNEDRKLPAALAAATAQVERWSSAGRALVEQPIISLGSEGETGIVARNLGAFLWLPADGFGPREAATADEPEPD